MDDVLLGRSVDAPLDARGQSDAHRLAGRFAALCRERTELLIEASPRRRAQQTAQAISARLRRAIFTANAVDEVDFGCWAGQSFAQLTLDPAWQRWNEHRSLASTPAGDTMADVQWRAIGHLRRLGKAFPACTVAIVTHAEIIRAALMHCLGMSVDSYGAIDIAPASVTIIEARDGRLDVKGINEGWLS